jgi:hypothetical protein
MENVKRYLLTNLNTAYWANENIPYSEFKKEIDRLNQSNKPILGELRDKDWHTTDVVSLSNVSHIISNLSLENDNCIYGDVEMLRTPMGLKMNYFVEQNMCKFLIRAIKDVDKIEIITWDITA